MRAIDPADVAERVRSLLSEAAGSGGPEVKLAGDGKDERATHLSASQGTDARASVPSEPS